MAEVRTLPTSNGSNTLIDFKIELIKKHQKDYIFETDAIVKALQNYGFQINIKYKRESLKKLDTELYELRTKHIRIFLYFDGNDFFILLHGFLKKSQETPKSEIKLAKEEIKRCKQMLKNS